MTDEELINILEQEEANCIGTYSGTLSEQRRKALQYYYGQPYGNEVEGRSQVVTTETLDAIEGIMPSLMAIFTSSDEIVRFDPQGPEDEEAAQQATDYVNYIFSRVNNGFLVLYCLFKDALLLKNGFTKVYWENYEDYSKETYEGLTDDQFTYLAMGDEVEVLQHTEVPGPQGNLHNAVFRTKQKKGKVCLDPCPPEEVLIARETPNELEKGRFVEHRRKISISRLREMGFEVEDNIQDSISPAAEFNLERQQRSSFDDSNIIAQDHGNIDPSSREVWVCESELRVDYDGDKIAELRKIIRVGKTILSNEEIDTISLVTGSPILMPHKIMGLSIADLVASIQEIKSAVTRNLLDNFYFVNNARWEVLDGMVNMDDMLTNRPGGVIRTKVLGAVKRQDTPLLGAPAFEMLSYFDQVKESRVGKRTFAPGPNADILKGSATGAEVFKQWDSERTELIARILAETAVKQMFWKILELVSKHQDKPQVVKLRGRWATVDPREWKNKFNMTVTVGLGTGSQQAVMQGAMGIMQIQEGALKLGMGDKVVTPKNFYEACRAYAKSVFPKKGDIFFTDPSTVPDKPQPPDPEMLKIQLAAHKAEMGDAQKRDKMAIDAQLEQMRQKLEAGTVQFKAMMDRSEQSREHQSEISKIMLEQESQNRQKVIDAISQMKAAKEQGATEQQGIVLQGIIDSLIAQQQHQHTQMQTLLKAHTEAMLAPKETSVRPAQP